MMREEARWRASTLDPALRKAPRRARLVRSGERPLADVYAPPDVPAAVGWPGEAPFTRGIYPSMYRSAPWTMRQYAGFGTAAESNRRYRYLLEQGVTGLSVAFDLPTQMGFDSDDPMALGEVGRVGVAIDSLSDMRVLFQDIPLDSVSTSMTINATASTLLSLYVAVAEERGIAAAALRGTVQNDILKEYFARGTYIYPPRASMRIVTDLFAWCRDRVPQWNTISISGYHIREAGATAAQELAFTLADGIAYVEAAVAAGLSPDAIGPRLSFFFNAHNHLLEEVAKFRAARRMWASIMRDRFGAKDPRSLQLRFHAQTAGSTLTGTQIDNNVVRVSIQALAAVLGGAQSLHTNGRDEALALPTEASARLALRTQQVLLHESGVADVVDPLGGSWAVEALTDELEAEARGLIDTVDGLGGMVAAIEDGFPQREIQGAAYAAQLAVDRGQAVVVGVNRFVEAEGANVPTLQVDPDIEAAQVAATRAHRSRRDEARALGALAKLADTATSTGNLLPDVHAAVLSGCTVGEISHTLRRVFGTWRA